MVNKICHDLTFVQAGTRISFPLTILSMLGSTCNFWGPTFFLGIVCYLFICWEHPFYSQILIECLLWAGKVLGNVENVMTSEFQSLRSLYLGFLFVCVWLCLCV